jgi:hypothetical protein
LKKKTFAAPGFEAQIYQPVANGHTEYEISAPTYLKVAMPLGFATVTSSWLCGPSPILEDELSL